MQHQAAPVTPVHVPKGSLRKESSNDEEDDEWDEEQRTSAEKREHGPQRQGSQSRVPGWFFFKKMPVCLVRSVQVRAVEVSSLRQDEEKK